MDTFYRMRLNIMTHAKKLEVGEGMDQESMIMGYELDSGRTYSAEELLELIDDALEEAMEE